MLGLITSLYPPQLWGCFLLLFYTSVCDPGARHLCKHSLRTQEMRSSCLGGGTPFSCVVWHPLGAACRYLHQSCGPQHPPAVLILLAPVNACMRLLWLQIAGSCWGSIYPVKWVVAPSSRGQRWGRASVFHSAAGSLVLAEDTRPSPAVALEMVP